MLFISQNLWVWVNKWKYANWTTLFSWFNNLFVYLFRCPLVAPNYSAPMCCYSTPEHHSTHFLNILMKYTSVLGWCVRSVVTILLIFHSSSSSYFHFCPPNVSCAFITHTLDQCSSHFTEATALSDVGAYCLFVYFTFMQNEKFHEFIALPHSAVIATTTAPADFDYIVLTIQRWL